MHISDGILPATYCVAGYAGTISLIGVAARKTNEEDIPKIAVFSAAFFVSSLIHIKLGFTSAHLSLIGLLGIMLGWKSVLSIFTGLLFQAVMFQHGGITTLGINTIIFSATGLVSYYFFKNIVPFMKDNSNMISLSTGIISIFSVFLTSMLVMLIISSQPGLTGFAVVFSISNVVLGIIEGIITTIVLRNIIKIKPEMIDVLWNTSIINQ